MEPQTRKLLRLLANERTERLIDALGSGPAQEGELLEQVGESQQNLNRRLRELETFEIVEVGPPALAAESKRGPRARTWRLVDEEAARFLNAADQFALERLELHVQRMRAGIDRRRRRQIAEVGEESV